jgi:ankyrin repeat protein
MTTLIFASIKDHTKINALLNKNDDVNLQNKDGSTAYDIAKK